MADSDFVGIRLEGGARLRRTLRQAGLDMKDLSAVNKRAANIVAAKARQDVPYGPDKNGHLRSTIRTSATQRAGTVRVGDKKRPYAAPDHWGWYARGIKGNAWLSRTAQDTEPQWVQEYWQGLMNVLDSIQSGD